MDTDLLVFNGINGATGEYLFPPMTLDDFSELIKDQSLARKRRTKFKRKRRQYEEIDLGPKEGIDPKKLSESGWGVIFAHNADPAIREALNELLVHRKRQATAKNADYYKEFVGMDGYRQGESKLEFLARHGAGPGPADPKRVPYYLLIVGSPELIPFDFQFQLDVQYAVGRIFFQTVEEYARYAHSVVTAETTDLTLPRRAVFFGVKNPDDPATALSASHLVKPLADSVKNDQSGWTVETILRDDATKAKLTQLLGGSQSPAFLFTASHGMGFASGTPFQLKYQGALLCQDWPGPNIWQKPIPNDFYFSSEDVGDHARLHGMITFHFACYGAGTPKFDEFAHEASPARKQLAPHAFLAQLPQRLLSHPNGGALAVIGHVERAWDYSFLWSGAGRQLATFEGTIKRLLDGHPVGSAIEYFNERYAEISSDLRVAEDRVKRGEQVDNRTLCGMCTANNDARNYAVIGDPAVRLPGNDAA